MKYVGRYKQSDVDKFYENMRTYDINGRDVEVPAGWSENAARIVATRYFAENEYSVKQLIGRVISEFRKWASASKLGVGDEWVTDLHYLLVSQTMAFNSPVWFNVGVQDKPQGSACFINPVEDSLDSIMELANTEAVIFRWGSGAGVNLSKIRSSKETLTGGGTAAGPLAFMRGYDAFADGIRSGGKLRRAAKMQILDADHPDIFAFVEAKSKEELKKRALLAAGFSGGIDGEANRSVMFQNSNFSVRVTDAFMQAVMDGAEWHLTSRKDGSVIETIQAADLWNAICESAWKCGCPGIQFHDTINAANTLSHYESIVASNPCQPAWATVLTPAGIRRIDQVEIGDEIWTQNGWSRIHNKWSTGVKPVYAFKTRAGVFNGTENHHVFQNGNRVPVGMAETIDTIHGSQWSSRCIDPQFVMDGLVLGDGMVHQASENLPPLLCIGEKDSDYHASEITELIQHERFGVSPFAWAVQTTLTRDEVCKTYDRRVPRRFIAGTGEEVASFLRGLYSANGSICANRVTLKAASLGLIEDVQQMLSSIGIPSYYTVNKPTKVKFSNGEYECKQSYDLNITHGRQAFLGQIGFIQKYKQKRLVEVCGAAAGNRTKSSFEIVEREYLGDEEVFDITVEADCHNYWTGGLLVSNCSEFMHINDTSCNLASINLRKYDWTTFEGVERFKHDVRTTIIGMELIIDNAGYPTERIELMTRKTRPLGLGFSNLGATLIAMGIPYGSPEGLDLASTITALMSGMAWQTSAEMANDLGPYALYDANAHGEVMYDHLETARGHHNECEWWPEALSVWEAIKPTNGYRNSQTTVLAPCGTIAFMMDCSTTGIEPAFDIDVEKELVHGGSVSLTIPEVLDGLRTLGYPDGTRMADVQPEHRDVFRCAVGDNALAFEDHILMMAACQPYLSGAISKTVNLPASATAADVGDAYEFAWQHGLKAVAIYRDGSKAVQPLKTKMSNEPTEVDKLHEVWNEAYRQYGDDLRNVICTFRSSAALCTGDEWDDETGKAVELITGTRPSGMLPTDTLTASDGEPKVTGQPRRERLPDTRRSMTHKFTIGQHEGYITLGLYDDGRPGEVFVKMSKEGSTVSGLMDTVATLLSYTLQHGVPFSAIADKLRNTKFDPSGMTSNKDIRFATSLVDYLVRWVEAAVGDPSPRVEPADVDDEGFNNGMSDAEKMSAGLPPRPFGADDIVKLWQDEGVEMADWSGSTCQECGSVLYVTGTCKTCKTCGWNGGCG